MDNMSLENTVEEYNKAMKIKLIQIDRLSSIGNLEKESIRIGLVTGLYSLMYWTEQLHAE